MSENKVERLYQRTMMTNPMHPLLSEKTANRLVGLFVALIIAFLWWQIGDTAMWRDELQTWVIARDSATLGALWHELGFEGFPPLWFFLTKAVQLFTPNPESMQYIHVGIASLNLFLLWRFAPFPACLKGILLLSFPFCIQYALFARCYAITLSFLIGAAALYHRKRPVLYWLCLGLGGQATILGLSVACAMGLQRLMQEPKRVVREWPGVMLFGALVVFALIAAWPNPDRALVADIGNHPPPLAFLQNAAAALVWPAVIADFMGWVVAALFLLIVLVAASAIEVSSLVSLAALLAAFLIVDQIGYPLLPHHLYLLPIGVMLFLWQAPKEKQMVLPFVGLGILFFGLAITGVTSLSQMSSEVPRSQGKNVAQWIKGHGLQEAFWIAVPDYTATTVSGYLGRPFYYPQCQCERGAPRWSKRNEKVPALPVVFEAATTQMNERGLNEAYLLLGNAWGREQETAVNLPTGYGFDVIYQSGPALVADEAYTLVKLWKR